MFDIVSPLNIVSYYSIFYPLILWHSLEQVRWGRAGIRPDNQHHPYMSSGHQWLPKAQLPSTHYLHSSHRDKQTTGTAPVSRKSVRTHRVLPMKYAYLNPSRKGSASFLSPRAKSLSLRQLAHLAASTLYSRTSAGPHRFPPPPKKRNGCDIANVIIFRQLTKQTEYIVTTKKSSIKRKGRCPNFRFPQSRKSDGPLKPVQ